MTEELRQVEKFMLAIGQQIRHQPITTIPTFEMLERIEVVINKLHELTYQAGIRVASHPKYSVPKLQSDLTPELVLRRLTELQYILLSLYHTFGLSQYAEPAFQEVHESNLTRVWPDQKIHKQDGFILNPTTYREPNIKRVLGQFTPPLFDDTPLKREVEHVDGEPCDSCQ